MEHLGEKRPIRSLACEYINGELYAYSCDWNAICEYNFATQEVKVFRGRKKTKNIEKNLYVNSIVYKKFIYFLPYGEGNLIKFSVDSFELKEIPVVSSDNAINPVIYKGILYLFPVGYSDRIPFISLDSDAVGYREIKYLHQLNISESYRNESLFCGNVCIGQWVYRVCRVAAIIQKYNIEEDVSYFYEIKGIEGKFKDIVYDGKYFWIIIYDSGKVLKWSGESRKSTEIIDVAAQLNLPDLELATINCFNGNIYFTSVYTAHIIYIKSGKKQNIFIIDCQTLPGFSFLPSQAFANATQTDSSGNVYFIPYKANGIVVLRQDGLALFVEASVQSNKLLEALGYDGALSECMCSVDIFYRLLVNNRTENIRNDKIGEKIWNSLKGRR